MKIIDGKSISEKVLEECRVDVEKLRDQGLKPGLAVVLVGNDPASKAYVGSKARACIKLGLHSLKIELPESTSQEELIEIIHKLNNDSEIHGILVQSPPPDHIDESSVVLAIDPAKDVDGFHPENVAKLVIEDTSGFVPCTPLGCQRLLAEYSIDTNGANVVIVGRSMIVGKPMALLLMAKGPLGNATVTVAHSRTKDLEKICKEADILIAAVGRPKFLGIEHVKDGAVVIDVGINRVEDSSSSKGYRLVGDVDFDQVSKVAKAITPVPGGVGPMTISCLLNNTVECFKKTHSK